MYEIRRLNAFLRELKKVKKRNLPIDKLDEVVGFLQKGERLPKKYKDHPLVGDWIGHRECHIQPDWLLVYKIEKNELVLVLCHTGTHSDIF